MNFAIGALIALAVGLTGIGGGSFTVPALVLLVGLSANASVGTAFVFAGVLRLIATPFYIAGRNVHGRYLWLLLQGAVPGLLIGTLLLRLLEQRIVEPAGGGDSWLAADGFFEHHIFAARAVSGIREEKFATGFRGWRCRLESRPDFHRLARAPSARCCC